MERRGVLWDMADAPDEKRSNEKPFMREKIVKPPLSRRQTAVRVFRLFLSAVIFGVVAAISFAASRPLAERFLGKEPETTPAPTITIERDEPGKEEETQTAESESLPPESQSEAAREELEGIVKKELETFDWTRDKVEGMNSGSLAVIYDMSYLKLELAVDELDIGKVAVGQSVSITADALEGQTFTGVVDKVSINGTTSGGATSYPVTIVIENYGELKPGMNVSATIEGDRVPNALCIPVDAVNRGNTVTVPGPGAMNADNTAVADVSKLETREVTLGKSDGDYIEVTGGLEEGDTVLIANQSSSMMNMVMGM